MEAITIPSPSAFLRSPVMAAANAPSPPPSKRKPSIAKQSSTAPPKKPTDPSKPKQSKSRNGCTTCKAKRLKCDETKPTCLQCQKRSVTCGGYKKDFKWRPFEEASFVNKSAPAPRARRPTEEAVSFRNERDTDVDTTVTTVSIANSSTGPSVGPTAESIFSQPPLNIPSPGFIDSMLQSALSSYDMTTPTFLRDPQISHVYDEPANGSRAASDSFPAMDQIDPQSPIPRSDSAGQSPRLIDLLLPGSELTTRSTHLTLSEPGIDSSPFGRSVETSLSSLIEDDVEEIVRQPDPSHQPTENMLWAISPTSSSFSNDRFVSSTLSPLYRQPEVQAGSHEMLILRYNQQTCGILSVKDGPTENPWRTLIWPLAKDSPALYHALVSMAAFHTSKERPALRVEGMEHMRRSIRSLATGIEKMRVETALATTLALAFSESWDRHISTGIEHLRGARILVQRALSRHKKHALIGDDLARLRFLCNTWVYMDVIARLTSVTDDDPVDIVNILAPVNTRLTTKTAEVDPLMGCATTLFPLIGKAAMLCRAAQRVKSNSLSSIGQASELKERIEQWQPATEFVTPEDPTAEVRHALQTAEAYRYATLLYLHQAFPEIPSPTSAELAKKVLICLVTVPLSSRLVIVQIYPLLAAGCEAHEPDDRQWVRERWRSMVQRMWIGNIDRCWEVVEEVWRRRDCDAMAKASQQDSHHAHAQLKRTHDNHTDLSYGYSSEMDSTSDTLPRTKRQRSSVSDFSSVGTGFPCPSGQRRASEAAVEELDPEYTVRGRLHWVGVMKDWQWEILLG